MLPFRALYYVHVVNYRIVLLSLGFSWPGLRVASCATGQVSVLHLCDIQRVVDAYRSVMIVQVRVQRFAIARPTRLETLRTPHLKKLDSTRTMYQNESSKELYYR